MKTETKALLPYAVIGLISIVLYKHIDYKVDVLEGYTNARIEHTSNIVDNRITRVRELSSHNEDGLLRIIDSMSHKVDSLSHNAVKDGEKIVLYNCEVDYFGEKTCKVKVK